jgi:hypothetical protein
MNPLLTPTNGSKPHVEKSAWLQQTVQQFFNGFNWEDQPPEIQKLRAAFQANDTEPLSLRLTVSQFFGSINWEGNQARCFADTARVATPIDSELTFIEDLSAIDVPNPDDDGFTLDDFSDLF